MYASLAGWFHLVTAPGDHAEEAASVLGSLRDSGCGPVADVLELGCGGGDLSSRLKHEVVMALTAAAPEMLDVSRCLGSECEHVEGDTRPG